MILSSTKDFKLGGYAGTGKTTVIRKLMAEIPCSAVCAYTGKAAHVLQRKGIGATTIHRLIYEVRGGEDDDEPRFQLKDEIDCSTVIVDEASMVNADLYADLMSFGARMIWVGDPGQLEPVGTDIALMHDPDYVLTQVHRQGEGSDILDLATRVRTGEPMADNGYSDVEFGQGDPGGAEFDQILCGFNRTRHRINESERRRLGYEAALEVGDKLVCLQNNPEYGVFNGMVCYVEEIRNDCRTSARCTLRDDLGNQLKNIPVSKVALGVVLDRMPRLRTMTLWDYGYALTVHKAQGSEWDRVALMDETWSGIDAARWRYTGITRAAKRLWIGRQGWRVSVNLKSAMKSSAC